MAYTIREATPDDNDALIRCELDSPIELGSVTIRFDRGPDYFAAERLRGHAAVVVAEEDGEIVGIMGGAWHPARIDGRERTLLYIHQGRVPPRHQRRGIGGALAATLNRWIEAQGVHVDSPYWYIAPTNERSMAFGSRGSQPWSADAYLHYFPAEITPAQVIPTRPLAGSDLPHAVELINRTRDDQELFLPYTLERFHARLGRSAEYTARNLYGLWEGDHLLAAAGVWDSGRCMRTIREDRAEGTVLTRSALTVLDYGFAAGRPDAWRLLFLGLLETAKTWGRTGVQVTAPPRSEAFGAIADLPQESLIFKLFTPNLPEPPGAARHGIYMDPVYL